MTTKIEKKIIEIKCYTIIITHCMLKSAVVNSKAAYPVFAKII